MGLGYRVVGCQKENGGGIPVNFVTDSCFEQTIGANLDSCCIVSSSYMETYAIPILYERFEFADVIADSGNGSDPGKVIMIRIEVVTGINIDRLSRRQGSDIPIASSDLAGYIGLIKDKVDAMIPVNQAGQGFFVTFKRERTSAIL